MSFSVNAVIPGCGEWESLDVAGLTPEQAGAWRNAMVSAAKGQGLRGHMKEPQVKAFYAKLDEVEAKAPPPAPTKWP